MLPLILLLRRVVHIVWRPKWERIYSDDRFHLNVVLGTLGINHVLDVGAAAGQFARSLRSSGYAFRITSIEPLRESWYKLDFSSRQDSSWRVFRRCALGGFAEERYINISANNDSSSFLNATSKSIQAAPKSAQIRKELVQIYALDDLFSDIVSADDAVLLKLDVQGYEKEVIAGAATSISQIKAVLVEMSLVKMYQNQPLWLEMIQIMNNKGFTPFAVFKGFCDEKTGQSLQIDVLFVNTIFCCK